MAKVTRPQPLAVLPRERLFAALDEGRHRGALVWVSGPAGAGKTTLVSSYVEARGLDCLWYQVDSGDADLASFFHYLGLAGRRAAPRRRSLPHLTTEYAQGILEFSRNFFEALYGRLRSPGLLVFDNLQEVPGDAPLHGALLEGLSRRPSDVGLVLVSRGAPPGPYARARANRALTVLDWDALRLTPEETAGMARLRGAREIAPEAARSLQERARGWAAGVQLLLEADGTGGRNDAYSSETPGEIFEYLGQEIFARVPEELQGFLLRSSVLPSMTAGWARDLTGESAAGRILSDLSRRGLFVERRPGPVPAYQYHPLLQEFLNRRATLELPAEDFVALQRRASALLAGAGRDEEAAFLLQCAGDGEGLAALIRDRASELLEQGRGAILEGWLRALSEEMVEADPWLVHWRAACRLPRDPGGSLGGFQDALRRFRALGEALGIFRSWCGWMDAIRYDWAGSHRRWDEGVAAMEEILTDHTFPSPEVECAVARRLATALDWRQPGDSRGVFWRSRVLELAGDDLSLRLEALAHAGHVQVIHGGEPELSRTVDALERALTAGEASPHAVIGARLALAMYPLVAGPSAAATAQARAGLELARESGVHVWDVLLRFVAGIAAVTEGERERAGAELRAIASLPDAQGGFGSQHYHLLACWVSMVEGRMPQALAHAEAFLEASEHTGFPSYQAWARWIRAQVRRAIGDRAGSWQDLEEALRLCRERRIRWVEWGCLVVRAHFCRLDGNDDRAADAVAEAFGLGVREGYLYGSGAAAMASLCALALHRGIEPDYARRLIRARGLRPSPEARTIEAWPWPLRFRTLGRFEILRDGKPLRSADKAQQKPLALLRVILALGGRNVAESRLVDDLWPDATGDRQHQAFQTAVHRLRNLLGVREAVRVEGGQVTIEDRICWVDAWAFEQLLDEAERAGDPTQLQRVLALYEGPFLPNDLGEPWSVPARERLRRRFLRGIERLADHHVKAGNWERAADAYRRGLDVDPLAETFYQGLMVCHRELGRPAEARAVYWRCRAVLAKLLGVEPCAETETLLGTLTGGDGS